jgi:hypothetical protein
MYTWSKPLSRTDAQVRTKGYPVRYLRFTQSGNPQDVWVWFRRTFFAAEPWYPSNFGRAAVERADITVDVTVLGKAMGPLACFLTYNAARRRANKTPTVYLHYPLALIAELRSQNLAKRQVTVQNNQGAYSLVIT